MTKPFRIGLAWHSTRSSNLGVGALTVGNMALASAAAMRVGLDAQFVVFSPRETGPPYVEDVETRVIDGRYMTSRKGFLADVGNLDIMLDIGAGDSFTDIYPRKRFLYLWGTKALTVARSVPLIFSPQTIGPFTKVFETRLAAWALNRAAAVFARDPLSFAALKDLAPRAPGFQVIDVAFALPFTAQPKAEEKVRVGLNISGLLYNRGYSGGNEFGIEVDYRALNHLLIERFAAMPGVEVHLVGHVFAPNQPRDDDGATADALAAQYPGLVRAPHFTTPGEAKSYISGLDFLVGGRMHATIAAYSSGVPVVPISYSRKFEGLFGGLGYKWLVPVRGLSTEAAADYVIDAFERRAELATDIGKGLKVVEQGLETYIAELAMHFAAAAARRP
ncbi:polysaccharide pyruvyl transferase family protein [Glacieibacterium sp.]|uniref:polysaccharide pyruvyl transferase family protein n=1 Tax=Glacieibacterium sp. TaxID=2860237 RepID=UPI003AFF896B